MAGRGPSPKRERSRRNSPERGEWQPSPEGGWQHELPAPPKGLLPASARVWDAWFRAWWAGHWTPDDLPQLRFVIRLHDRVRRGDVKHLGELRQWLDAFGITPKGQQDRRWERPAAPKPGGSMGTPTSRYRHLRITSESDDPYRDLRVEDDPPHVRERFGRTTDERPAARERFGALEQRR